MKRPAEADRGRWWKFRDEHGLKKPVELRKLLKSYLTFIKASQRFYRGYITRLGSTFNGIPELEEIAHRFKQMGKVILGTGARHGVNTMRC